MKHATQIRIDFLNDGNYDTDKLLKLLNIVFFEQGMDMLGADFESMDHAYTELRDVIRFDTYPDMFTDYENMIENKNYDHEHRVFEVPRDWALKWIDENTHYEDGFWNEYTYDDTMQMYEDALRAGALISETIEPE